MSRLELKIPPDLVWLVVAGLMWLASDRTPRFDVSSPVRVGTAIALTVAGVWAIVSARALLQSADTTWHPMSPGRSTSLVTSGVFGVSRNPIYLGMLLVLLAWAVYLASPAALVVSSVFVLYLDRFQVVPEERALAAILGQEYSDYLARVRRWI